MSTTEVGHTWGTWRRQQTRITSRLRGYAWSRPNKQDAMESVEDVYYRCEDSSTRCHTSSLENYLRTWYCLWYYDSTRERLWRWQRAFGQWRGREIDCPRDRRACFRDFVQTHWNPYTHNSKTTRADGRTARYDTGNVEGTCIHTTQRPRELTVGQHATTLGTSDRRASCRERVSSPV